MVEFYDGWEEGQTWNVLWGAVADRVTTDPFRGSYCLRMVDSDGLAPAGVSKDGIFDPTEDAYLRIAVKNASATHSAEVCLYNPNHTRIALIFQVGGAGTCSYRDETGTYILYAGSLGTWYEFRVAVHWATEKFDIAVYDKNGTRLGIATDRPFLNSSVIETIAHILLYSSIAGTGTSYYDGCSVTKYIPPSPAELNLSESGVLLTEKLVDPPPSQGYWIVGYWMRRVRAIYDKTLADDHDIARAILNKIKDVEAQKA